MRSTLRSLFSSFRSPESRRRKSRCRKAVDRSVAHQTVCENLEERALLAAQFIASDAPSKTLSAGETIDIPVMYRTLDDNGDPAALQGSLITFNLHFDADALTFVESKSFFGEGLTVPPTTARSESEVPGDDGDAATETILLASYDDNDSFVNPGWPNNPATAPLQLYIATFTAKPGFSGTKINFSANTTGNITGGAGQFTFGSTSLDLNLPVADPVISIADAPSVTEGNDSLFTVTLDKSSTSTITVMYSTMDGTGANAANGNDYTARLNQTLTFSPGETQKQIAVPTVDDTIVESAETFGVNLFNPSGATIGTAQATGTIGDNDSVLPSLSIADAQAVTEGAIATFTVTLSESVTSTVTVSYSTADGTGPQAAIGGVDFFNQTNQTLTFDPGETQKTISIATEDDPIVEPTENFRVSLFNPAGATIATATATGLIDDDDASAPTISIADAADVAEGNNAMFTVTLSAAASGSVTVSYSTVDGNGPTAAVGGQDFIAQSSQTLTFTAGQTQKTISIVTIDDPVVENDETFSVVLSNANGATITTAEGTGTITDNDVAPPSISIADAQAVSEGGDALFVVTLSSTSLNTVTVDYSTIDGNGPNGAMGGSDFVAQTNQTLTFSPGQTQKTIAIATSTDLLIEASEEFTVALSNANGASISSGQATGTINDVVVAPPALSIADAAAVTEGNDATFTVTLDKAPVTTVTVMYSTTDGNGPTGAIAGSDFVSVSNQVLTFNAGETQKTITIRTIDDLAVESAESFGVNLSGPVGATLGTPGAFGTINDNDGVPLPVISISDAATVTEGAPLVFSVTLSADPASIVTADFSATGTGQQPATPGQDFQTLNGTVTFSPGGPLTQQISIVTINDTAIEETESLRVTLSDIVGATVGDGIGIGEIEDNDTPVEQTALQGRKWNDLNGNGSREAGEPWLNGWTIQLLNSNGIVVEEQQTRDLDLNGDNQIDPASEVGRFRFLVSEGTYTLREVQQQGWQQTAPATPLEALAFDLDQLHKFRGTRNSFENWGGRGERWFIAENRDWFFVTPDGSLFQWNDSPRTNLTGTLIGSFTPAYWEDTSLIHDAQPATSATYTVTPGQVLPDVNFGNISLNQSGSIHGRKWHDLNGDGQRTTNEPWLNGWTIELVGAGGIVERSVTTMDVDLNGDNQIDPETESGWYWINDVDAGIWKVREETRPGWKQTSPADPADVKAWELDRELNLRFNRSLFPNWGGLNERWVLGDAGWYYITPNGDVFDWNGSPRNALTGTRVAQLDPKFHADPALLHEAQNPFEYKLTVSPGANITGVDFGNQEAARPQTPQFPGRGNVVVQISGPHLVLWGDNSSNGVRIYNNADGLVTVEGLGQTLISGRSEPLVTNWTSIPGIVQANMGAGDDALILNADVNSNVAVNMHGGNDYFIVTDATIAGALDFRSNTGNNHMIVTNSNVGNFVRSITGNGWDTFYSAANTFRNRTILSMGGGNDLFAAANTAFVHDVVADLSIGHDSLVLTGQNSFGQQFVAEGWTGHDAYDFDSSTSFRRAPDLRRFDQGTIENVDSVLDDLMQRLADAGLDGLLGAN